MTTFRVTFSDAAKADLFAIYDYIADHAGPRIAGAFVDRIEAYCLAFAQAPERETRRNDLRPNLRTVGFRRRATILFEVDRCQRCVVIHGVYYAGRNFETADDSEDE